jgi:hypothetical protein
MKTLQNMQTARIKQKKLDHGIQKIFSNVKTRINYAFKKNNIEFKQSYEEIIGCNIDIFENHIVNQLKEGMTIDNYGEWEIDHIKPISSFNLDNDNEIHECFNYKNLQPLWLSENRKKAASLTHEQSSAMQSIA